MFQRSFALSRAAIAAIVLAGACVAISNFSAVRAERVGAATHARPDKTCDSSTYCVTDTNTGSGGGFEATSTSGTGIQGNTSASNGDSGVAGIDTGSAGNGVYGRASGGDGVHGTSSNANGVSGSSSMIESAGVYGNSSNGNGVTGESGSETTGNALYAQADNTNGFIFFGYNRANNVVCEIDQDANLRCDGTITGGGTLRAQHRNTSGQRVVAYAAESASATLEDVGTGRLVGGVGSVVLDRAFGSTIDRNAYHVFLTPDGDASLYVAQKTPAGFVVRETHGGRSTLDFDYRIIARPVDANADRLLLAQPMRRPAKAQRAH